MTRLAVLLDDPGRVDRPLLEALLQRWSDRSHVDVVVAADVAVVDDHAVDGIVVDVELDRRAPPAVPPEIPVVYVDVTDAARAGSGPGRLIYGRGIDTYRWALMHLAASLRRPPLVVPYGDHPDQVGELYIPNGPGPHPIVVLIHGGFWHRQWERDLMDDLAIDLDDAGMAAWNIEYRRGPGAWAETLDDVALAVDHLAFFATDHGLATERVALVGHSAGGHLVLWLGGRGRHGPAAARRTVDPVLVVPLAPVSDLVECAVRNLGEGAVVEFFGSAPDAAPERYASTDPIQRLPIGVATTIVQGLADSPDLVDLNRRFAARAAAAGEQVELLELDGTDHFDVIDPASDAWSRVRRLLQERLMRSAERHGRA